MPKIASRTALLLIMICARTDFVRAQSATSYHIDRAQSHIYVVTHRSGVFSFLGHEHALLATQWSGSVCWAPAAPANGHGTIEVATGALVIDSDSARAIARLGGGPSPGQVRTIQAKALDREHLDAADYPTITLRIERISEAARDRLQAHGQLAIRDRVRDVEFPITVAALAADSVRFRGTLNVRQTSFGIKPETVAAVVRVADVVDIHFDLLATATGAPCAK